MKLKQILNEIELEKNKWMLIPGDEVEKYEQRILSLIDTAYTKIGGNPNFKSVGDVRDKKNNYDVIDVNSDNSPDAVSVEKNTASGRKLVATGHDGSKDAKRAIIMHKIELLKKVGYFGEVSGDLKDILISRGVPVVTDESVVRKTLNGKDIVWNGDGTYQREIAGQTFTKTMVGMPT